MSSSRLLIDETPLMFLRTLAVVAGSERKAIALQQLHFLLGFPNLPVRMNDRLWVRATYADWWRDWFTWLPSTHAVKRIYADLRGDGYVLHEQFNIAAGDATSYLSIDYAALNAAIDHATKTVTWGMGRKPSHGHVTVSVEDHVTKIVTSTSRTELIELKKEEQALTSLLESAGILHPSSIAYARQMLDRGTYNKAAMDVNRLWRQISNTKTIVNPAGVLISNLRDAGWLDAPDKDKR